MDTVWEVLKKLPLLASILGAVATLITITAAVIFVYPRYRRRQLVAKHDRLQQLFNAVPSGDKQLDLVRGFLHSGVNADWILNKTTALMIAVENGQIETVRLLLSGQRLRFGRRWADPDLAPDRITPIQAAVAKNREDIHDVLLAAGALDDPATRSTVLRWAVESGDVAVVDRRIARLQEKEIDTAGDDGRNALLIAVEIGKVDVVRRLLAAKANANARCGDMTALLLACRDRRGEIATELLSRGASVDDRGPNGETPLILAAAGGSRGIVEELLDKYRAKADATDKGGRTALMAAVLGGHEPIADLLRPRSTAGEPEARLILAAEAGREAEVRELLANGANPNVTAPGRSALLGAARGGYTAIGRVLLEHNADPDFADETGAKAANLASTAGAMDFVDLLVNRPGADVETARPDGSTVLMDAVTNNRTHVVKYLLKRDPKPNVDARRTSDGFTPLMAAVENSNRKIAGSLLRAGADPNAETAEGMSPLMIAITRDDRQMARVLARAGATKGAQAGQLFVEVRKGDLAQVVALLAAGVSANLVLKSGNTPLLEAVRRGHLDIAAKLIAHQANVNHSGALGTALEWAARTKRLDLAQLLLDAGADVNGRGTEGKTALLVACERNHGAIVEELLLPERNADVDATDLLGRTPLLAAILGGRRDLEDTLRARGASKGEAEARLMLAAQEGNGAAVRALLERRPNVNARGLHRESALTLACERGDLAIVQVLLQVGADPNVKTASGKTPLTLAARGGDVKMLDALLKAGARIDLHARESRTALMIAAEAGHARAVERLLEVRINPNDRDRSGMTALMLAAGNGHVDVVSRLVAASADLDAHGPGGRTALMFAAAAGHAAVVETLVGSGAKVDERDQDEATALIHAVLGRKLDAAVELVRRADVNARDAFGETPLMIAVLHGDRPMETLLRGAGASAGLKELMLLDAAERGTLPLVEELVRDAVLVDAHLRGEHTALIHAIRHGHADVAQLLIAHRADVNARGRAGLTPLIAACAKGNLDLVMRLTEHGAGATVEAMDDSGRSAVFVARDDAIRLHLRDACGALQPGDPVRVAGHGRCYHIYGDCGALSNTGSSTSRLGDEVENGRRLCVKCLTKKQQAALARAS